MKNRVKEVNFKNLSIVIPVYNEEKYIINTINQVIKQNVKGFKNKEIVVVNDGSSDHTRKLLKDIAIKNRNIIVIYKNINEGKGSALKEGFARTSGDIIIIQDADMEYSPSDYNSLLTPFREYNADVVYGSRFSIYRPHRVMYFWHNVINNFLTTLSNVFTNLNLTDMETGFKCFKGDLIRGIAPQIKSKRFGFEPEITAKIAKIKGLRIYEVGISYEGRTYEEGKKINWKDGIKAVWEILRFNIFD